MPSKGEIRKREILPNSRYGDKLVAKFINTMMTAGKKSVLEGVFYGSLDLIAAKTKGDALGVFKQAVENTRPMLEVRSRRVGGSHLSGPRGGSSSAARLTEYSLADPIRAGSK